MCEVGRGGRRVGSGSGGEGGNSGVGGKKRWGEKGGGGGERALLRGVGKLPAAVIDIDMSTGTLELLEMMTGA